MIFHGIYSGAAKEVGRKIFSTIETLYRPTSRQVLWVAKQPQVSGTNDNETISAWIGLFRFRNKRHILFSKIPRHGAA